MKVPLLANSLSVRLCAVIVTTLMLSQSLHAIPLRVLAWNDEIAGRKLALGDAKGSVTIEAMHPSKRTKPYQVAAGDKPVVIQALDKTDKDGKPAASQILIPQGTKQPLLLLLPDEKSATGLRLHVIDDDTTDFPWGGIRFINASGKKLAFVFEKKSVILPVSWTPVSVNPGGVSRNMETQLFIFDQPAVPIYSAIWEQQQDVRMLIFIVAGKDPRLGPVAMKMISEDRRVSLAKPAADNKK
ncbi:MAG: hypothetical protein NTW21_34790 [Verrucomicrobia bacterium]|nr:hypothetical protein [Verrucomicrobiota bacterium]